MGEGAKRLPAAIYENLWGPSVSRVGGLGKASHAVARGRSVQENATVRVMRGDSKGSLRGPERIGGCGWWAKRKDEVRARLVD